MRYKLAVTILASMIGPFAATTPIAAKTIGAVVWDTCRGPMSNKYDRIRYPKVFVGGYRHSDGEAYCFWRHNKGLKYTMKNARSMITATLNDCYSAGYDLCQVVALNGSLTENGLRIRNLSVADARYSRQQRQQQTAGNVDAFLNAFVGGLGAAGAFVPSPPRETYRPAPRYNKQADNYIRQNNKQLLPGGSVCTAAQRARGWSAERCMLN
ncbi:hypothetical protein NKH91_30855 [Mesorhizobium sp. M0894]|uniref:hypothetical protein n=1 Tax=unclassified Mesorhizobium TaxID=325217 RepID=UPI00333C23C4